MTLQFSKITQSRVFNGAKRPQAPPPNREGPGDEAKLESEHCSQSESLLRPHWLPTTAMANPGVENVAKDVSSPAAAKARTAASMMNSSFVANIVKTPVSLFQKTPQIPLQKAVLLSVGMWRVVELERKGVYTVCHNVIFLYSKLAGLY